MKQVIAALLLLSLALTGLASCGEKPIDYMALYGAELPEKETFQYVDALETTSKSVQEIMKDTVMALINAGISDVGSLFVGEKLLFTEEECFCSAKNAVVYTVTDWTNADCYPNFNAVDEEAIYSSIMAKMGFSENNMGESFETLADDIEALIASNLEINNAYFFSRMDGQYEYRVVVRADFDYYTYAETYQVGILSGTWDSIVQMIGGSFTQLGSNYQYMKLRDELVNVRSLRYVVEYREAPNG